MTEQTIELILVVLFGMGWGSFATMAVYRIPRGIPWISTKPHCFSCQHTLTILDYVSILSYFLWRGKCRYCGQKYDAKISYFMTELGILGFFILAYLHYGFSDQFVLLTVCIVSLIVIAVIDGEHQKIPASTLISLMAIGIGYRTFMDQTFYGVVYGGILGGMIALAARSIYFRIIGQADIAKDYMQWQDTDRFCGPGFDYVKLMAICGMYLPVIHFGIYSLATGGIIFLWYFIHRQTLRLGSIMTIMLLITLLYFPNS